MIYSILNIEVNLCPIGHALRDQLQMADSVSDEKGYAVRSQLNLANK